MFLKEARTGDLVDVVDMASLVNPFSQHVTVQYQSGEDLARRDRVHQQTHRRQVPGLRARDSQGGR